MPKITLIVQTFLEIPPWCFQGPPSHKDLSHRRGGRQNLSTLLILYKEFISFSLTDVVFDLEKKYNFK